MTRDRSPHLLGSLLVLLASAGAQDPTALVFREFSSVQRLRVVCSQQHFGRIDDLVAEVPSGRLVAAVVTMHDEPQSRMVSVPFAELRYEPGANLLQLANCASKDGAYATFDPAAVKVAPQVPPTGGAAEPKGIVLVSRLQHGLVQLKDGGPGSAQGLWIELTGGHVAFLDLANGRERAGDADLHPVPWAALRFVDDGLGAGGAPKAAAPTLALAKTAAELAAAPNLIQIIVADPLYRAKLYAVFGVRPVFERS